MCFKSQLKIRENTMQRKERGGKEGKRKMEGVWCVTKAAGDKHRTGEKALLTEMRDLVFRPCSVIQ